MSVMWKGRNVVLASGSPRRRELLAQVGMEPEIVPSLVEECTEETEPDLMVMELSRIKAEDVASRCPEGTLVIGADTMVAVDKEVLGKPGTPERAAVMIEKLQGRAHQVYTGVTLLLVEPGGCLHGTTFVEKTDVYVYPMTDEEIRDYAGCGEPLDKAGAYGIQGRFAVYIRKIDGDYDNVVGLPLGRLYHELKNLTEDDREDD